MTTTVSTTTNPFEEASDGGRMRASVLVRTGVMEVEERARPVPDADQVLVQVAAVGVCGSDVHYYEHGRIGPYVVDAPLILGHELSGVIVATGAFVDSSRIGERVAVEPQRPCRRCAECSRGDYNLCPSMEFYATPPIDGAFAEFVLIQSEFAHPIPHTVSDEAAALIEPLSVAIAACRRAKIAPGARVLISGAGPIGILCAQAARAFGAAEVHVSDLVDARLDFALQHGATHAIRAAEADTSSLAVDAFIDASGAAAAVRAGIRSVRAGGYAILVGLGNDNMELPVSYIQDREIWVSGVFRYTNTWPLAIQLVESGAIDLDILVTSRFTLDEAEQALQTAGHGSELKVVVYPGR